MPLNLDKRRGISLGILFAFLVNTFGPIPSAQAQDFLLPAPGVMVSLSPEFNPPILKGIKVHPDNPFKFDFILDKGDGQLSNDALKDESRKLIKYFLASLTIPEKDLWVNLSPYEKDRIVPESFGQTEMGRDLLAEDYMLKQITASLIYPEGETGKKFWKRIYEEATKRFGTTNIPVNTFNKVWVVPEKAVVYENAKIGVAYVVETKLKVMLEQDYLSLAKHQGIQSNQIQVKGTSQIGSEVVREIVIPELTKEVNEGKNFAQLRQVYNSLILAIWYKKKIKDSILEHVYADKKKVAGVNIDDPKEKERIYQRYLRAFKKGVFNYINEDIDSTTGQNVPRKYFSGGMSMIVPMEYRQNINPVSFVGIEKHLVEEDVGINKTRVDGAMKARDQAMNTEHVVEIGLRTRTEINIPTRISRSVYEGLARFTRSLGARHWVIRDGMRFESKYIWWPTDNFKTREESHGEQRHLGMDLALYEDAKIKGWFRTVGPGAKIPVLVDGQVQWIFEDNMQSTVVTLTDMGNGSHLMILYTHIAPREGLEIGDQVKVGEDIGEIKIARNPKSPTTLHWHLGMAVVEDKNLESLPRAVENFDYLNEEARNEFDTGRPSIIRYFNPLECLSRDQRAELFLESWVVESTPRAAIQIPAGLEYAELWRNLRRIIPGVLVPKPQVREDSDGQIRVRISWSRNDHPLQYQLSAHGNMDEQHQHIFMDTIAQVVNNPTSWYYGPDRIIRTLLESEERQFIGYSIYFPDIVDGIDHEEVIKQPHNMDGIGLTPGAGDGAMITLEDLSPLYLESFRYKWDELRGPDGQNIPLIERRRGHNQVFHTDQGPLSGIFFRTPDYQNPTNRINQFTEGFQLGVAHGITPPFRRVKISGRDFLAVEAVTPVDGTQTLEDLITQGSIKQEYMYVIAKLLHKMSENHLYFSDTKPSNIVVGFCQGQLGAWLVDADELVKSDDFTTEEIVTRFLESMPQLWQVRTLLLNFQSTVPQPDVGMKAREDQKDGNGGIDLTPANKVLQTQNSGIGIRFHIDPAQLAQWQRAPGVMIESISIQPLKSLSYFLGLPDNQPTHQVASL